MRHLFMSVLVAMLQLFVLTFAGHCECDECVSECRCGNNDSSQECQDCVSSCGADTTTFKVFIGSNIMTLCLFVVKIVKYLCVQGNGGETSCTKVLSWITGEYFWKGLSLFTGVAGGCGVYFFWDCNCDPDPWGCGKYSGDITCPSSSGGDCYWDGYVCAPTETTTNCYCVDVRFSEGVHTFFKVLGWFELGHCVASWVYWAWKYYSNSKQKDNLYNYRQMGSM